jgi:hypothetical protein
LNCWELKTKKTKSEGSLFIFRFISVYVWVLYNSICGKKKKFFFRWCCKQRRIFFPCSFLIFYFIFYFANDSPHQIHSQEGECVELLILFVSLAQLSAVPLIYYRFSFASSSVFEFLLFLSLWLLLWPWRSSSSIPRVLLLLTRVDRWRQQPKLLFFPALSLSLNVLYQKEGSLPLSTGIDQGYIHIYLKNTIYIYVISTAVLYSYCRESYTLDLELGILFFSSLSIDPCIKLFTICLQ